MARCGERRKITIEMTSRKNFSSLFKKRTIKKIFGELFFVSKEGKIIKGKNFVELNSSLARFEDKKKEK